MQQVGKLVGKCKCKKQMQKQKIGNELGGREGEKKQEIKTGKQNREGKELQVVNDLRL